MEYRQNSPELPSMRPKNPELSPAAGVGELPAVANHERLDPRRSEQVAAPVETLTQASRVPPVVAPPVVVADDSTTAPATGVADASLPLVAGDVDLIEKEWVDKAKAVITETRDDPYRREQAVKQLQIEYVRKRYGRVIGGGDATGEANS